MSDRTVGAPAFLAGAAAAVLDGVFRDMGELMGRPNGLPLAVWIAIALIASVGAARVSTGWANTSAFRPPSIVSCGIACALGGFTVTLLPAGWLRLVGGAGLLLMLYLALGLLAGLVDIAMRITKRSPTAKSGGQH